MYFDYYNKHDKEGLLSVMTEHHNSPNAVWGFDDLEYMKIIELEDVTNSIREYVDDYLTTGRGSINGVKKENVRVFTCFYEVKYREETGPQNSGKYKMKYILIRQDERSPWLIDDRGY
ncbi:DUF4829 domain-containing protein [Heliobacterium chlorum]|uniref:DUF4829 domain-containing protein n=2 Tax=Heliobacterium chlorum TaxID=2698 RepID=A0ABR7T5S0_HELCL|nr:DUF4829 domain-containing protein [Heliobacterium chlorum]